MTNEPLPNFLDAALKRITQEKPVEQAAIHRVLARLSPPLPRQKTPLWQIPSVLLDWPRMVALAACAVLGFYVGIAGLDRRFDQIDARFASASRADLGSIVFEPESLTGARP